jgi:hypothetical protein
MLRIEADQLVVHDHHDSGIHPFLGACSAPQPAT